MKEEVVLRWLKKAENDLRICSGEVKRKRIEMVK